MATDAEQKLPSSGDTNWVLVDLSWRESLGKPAPVGSQVLAPALRKTWASAFHVKLYSVVVAKINPSGPNVSGNQTLVPIPTPIDALDVVAPLTRTGGIASGTIRVKAAWFKPQICISVELAAGYRWISQPAMSSVQWIDFNTDPGSAWKSRGGVERRLASLRIKPYENQVPNKGRVAFEATVVSIEQP